MRRALFVPLALTIALGAILGGGCKQAQTLGGKPRPKKYERVVSLSPSTTEIAAGNGINLVGRTSACDYPQQVTKVPVVGGVKPDYEALAKIKPDLVLYDKELYGEADVRKLGGLGATLFAWDPHTLAEYRERTFELGSLGAVETGLSGYVDRLDRETTTAQGDPPTPRPTVAVILPGTSGRHMIGGTKGLRADCVRVAGGEPVGPGGEIFEALSPEFLVGKDPDVILLAVENPPATPLPAGAAPPPSAARREFEGDARFAGLKARRLGHVYGIPADVLLRRGARVDALVRNLHKAFKFATQPAAAPLAPSQTPASTGAAK